MTDKHTPGPWVEIETESSVDYPDIAGWQDIGPEDGKPVAIALGYDRPTAHIADEVVRGVGTDQEQTTGRKFSTLSPMNSLPLVLTIWCNSYSG